MLSSTVLHCIKMLYCTVLYCSILCCSILQYIVLHFTVLQYVAAHYSVLCCAVLPLEHAKHQSEEILHARAEDVTDEKSQE